MNIFEKLGFNTNLEIGQIQSVDEMTILPLVWHEPLTKEIASPDNLKFQRTSNYGSMVWENIDNDNEAIVPNNTMILSKKSGQDHAMSGTGIIPGNKSITFNDACCVQENQSGYLGNDKDNENKYDILPLDLRKILLDPNLRFKQEYNKIWEDIKYFLQDIPDVTNSGGHLEYFFQPFEKELKDFVAEFEPVPNQIGAIVFFLNTPVGIEIMPNQKYWKAYWKWLIRGCYGSQLLKLKKSGKIKTNRLIPPKIEGEITIDSLLNSINGYLDNSQKVFKKIIDNDYIVKTIANNDENKLKQRLIHLGPNGGGDIVGINNKTVYASLVL